MSATSRSAPAHIRRPFRTLRFARDEELVRLVRAGDERAFETMYDRHHRGILAFCRHMLGSADEAEDAVQHAFIAAHRDLVGSDKPIQLKAWLYTIARNRCLSLLRARKDERALDDVPEPSVQGLATEVQQRQDLRDLLVDLQKLPEDQRAALVLSELGALSHEEIGTTLGVRKDKVKALVFQARESLTSSRKAREVDCREIQEQLAVLRGGSLRRTTLRRHVEVCPACSSFKAEVKRQRAAMASVLPVVPSLALKDSVLGAIIGGGGGGGGIIGGGLLAASGTKALVAKVTTVAVVAGGATGGGLVAVDGISGGGGNTATAMEERAPARPSPRVVEPERAHVHHAPQARATDLAANASRSPGAAAMAAAASDDAKGGPAERGRKGTGRAERARRGGLGRENRGRRDEVAGRERTTGPPAVARARGAERAGEKARATPMVPATRKTRASAADPVSDRGRDDGRRPAPAEVAGPGTTSASARVPEQATAAAPAPPAAAAPSTQVARARDEVKKAATGTADQVADTVGALPATP